MNKFESQLAIFTKTKNNTIKKQFKNRYKHLFQENIFKYLLNLNSKQIINLHSIDTENKILIFEYFPSINLRNRLKLDIPISINDLKSILKNIALSIDFLHKNNIAHIDINDTNILINDNLETKLNDFDFIEILTKNNLELKNIDIHSYIVLVLQIIYRPYIYKSLKHLVLNYNKTKLDYSNCLNFLDSLDLH